MQPIPTYETVPVLFDSATKVAIPSPTDENGYAAGATLPTEHFSWLENKVTKKIDELAATVTSLITEMDNYLVSRSVAPNGSAYNQFLTALAAQISGASVASAAVAASCSGNAATATNSAAVAGIDPINGNAGTFSNSYIELMPGATWIIPKGTYILTGYANNESGADSGNALQIVNTAGDVWFPTPSGARGPFQGMIISDGVHYRLYNCDPTYICISFYRKIA